MKIIAIGDIHGRTIWKKIVEKETFDKVVFIGDYFDSREYIYPHKQIDNFIEIIGYKEQYPDKVVLLFGNHDWHYLSDADEEFAGFNIHYEDAYQELLEDALNRRLLQMCYVCERFVFTHAGITKTWAKNVKIDLDNLQDSINELFYKDYLAFRFLPGANESDSGDDMTQSPIWVRPRSLLKDKLDDLTQIVGHTVQHQLLIQDDVAYIDVLGSSGEYLVIGEGAKVEIKKTRNLS